jgi:uncharacterized protein (DUF1697 family)
MYGPGTVVKERYNGVEYIIWEGDETTSYQDVTVTLEGITALYINNGYMYSFSYQAMKQEEDAKEDFYKILSSVVYADAESGVPLVSSAVPAVATYTAPEISAYTAPQTSSYYTPASSRSSSSGLTAEGVILSLIITVAVYSLPIIIYRYGIRKRPMEKSAAKKLTIIYGIVAFIVMTLIVVAMGGNASVGGAIFLWSAINYAMLTKGQDMRGINEINKKLNDGPSPAMWLGEPVGAVDGETTYVVMLCGWDESPQTAEVDLLHICRQMGLHILDAFGNGSVVVTAAETESALRMRVGGRIVETYRRAVTVVIRTLRELEQTLNAYPFSAQEGYGLYLAMAPMPTYAHIEAVKTAKDREDEVRSLSRDIFIRTRYGLGEKLLAQLAGMGAAVRSWETANAIVGHTKADTETAQEKQPAGNMEPDAEVSGPVEGVHVGLGGTTDKRSWNIGPEEDKKGRSDKKEKGYDRGRARLRGDESKRRGHDPHNYWRGD